MNILKENTGCKERVSTSVLKYSFNMYYRKQTNDNIWRIKSSSAGNVCTHIFGYKSNG